MIKNCRNCGREFEDGSRKCRGRKSIYCSHECKEKKNRDDRLSRSNNQCLICGKRVLRGNYCKDCKGIPKRINKGTTRICIICGNAFEPKARNTECCSLECSKKSGAITLMKIAITNCERCGVQIEYKYINVWTQKPKWCKPCYSYIESDRSRRRRLITDVQYGTAEYIDLDLIRQRDHDICQLCGEIIDFTLKWPDVGSPTIDHIIPISKGGLHVIDNVQLAHFTCNNRKHDNILEGEYPFNLCNLPIRDRAGKSTRIIFPYQTR